MPRTSRARSGSKSWTRTRYLPQHAVHKRTRRRIFPNRYAVARTSAEHVSLGSRRRTRTERLLCSCATTALSLEMKSSSHLPLPVRTKVTIWELLDMVRRVCAEAEAVATVRRSQTTRQTDKLPPALYLDGMSMRLSCARDFMLTSLQALWRCWSTPYWQASAPTNMNTT